jgi:hypothetical protein
MAGVGEAWYTFFGKQGGGFGEIWKERCYEGAVCWKAPEGMIENEGVRKGMDNRKLTRFGFCFRQTVNAILLAGIMIFFIGVYYCVVKAGIPYQNPPLELQIQYAVHMEIGEILVKDGCLISLCGGGGRLLLKWVLKKKK